MSHILRRIRADWLYRLASGEPGEIGQVGQPDRYPPRIAQAIGPMVAYLHRVGIIAHAGATYATRPARRRTVARLWRATDPAACAALAAADVAWLASHPADDDAPPSEPRQLLLF